MNKEQELERFLAADAAEPDERRAGNYADAIGSFVKQTKTVATTAAALDEARLTLRNVEALAKNWTTLEVPEDADERQRAWVEATNAAGDLLAITLRGPKVVEPS